MADDIEQIIDILRENGVKTGNQLLEVVLQYGREKKLLKENARLKNAIKNMYEMSNKEKE